MKHSQLFASLLLATTAVSVALAADCNTKWVRLVYVTTCGKKKRDNAGSARAGVFSEELPRDIDQLIAYYRMRDPTHPLFQDNDRLLKQILEDQPGAAVLHDPRLRRANRTLLASEQQPKKASVSLKRLGKNESYDGIPGFPQSWDIEELLEVDFSAKHRREINTFNALVDICCRVPPVSACNEDTFFGACK